MKIIDTYIDSLKRDFEAGGDRSLHMMITKWTITLKISKIICR